MQVFTWLSNIAFHLRLFWLQTLVVIDSESCQRSFSSFCAPPSEVAVLFRWNLSRRPVLRPILDLDLLLFLFRDRRMIERLSEAMSAALVCMTRYQGLANSIENFISHGIRIPAQNSQSIDPRARPFILQSNLRLSSGTAFGSDCQMTGRAAPARPWPPRPLLGP